MKKLQKLIERIGLKRYLKSLQFRIFIILCVVGIVPILLEDEYPEKLSGTVTDSEGKYAAESV